MMTNRAISAQTVVWHRQDSALHGDRRVPLRAVRILDERDIEKCKALSNTYEKRNPNTKFTVLLQF